MGGGGIVWRCGAAKAGDVLGAKAMAMGALARCAPVQAREKSLCRLVFLVDTLEPFHEEHE